MFPKAGNVAGELSELLGRCLEPLGFSVQEASRVKGAYKGYRRRPDDRYQPPVRSRNRYATPDVSYRAYDEFSLEFAVENEAQNKKGPPNDTRRVFRWPLIVS